MLSQARTTSHGRLAMYLVVVLCGVVIGLWFPPVLIDFVLQTGPVGVVVLVLLVPSIWYLLLAVAVLGKAIACRLATYTIFSLGVGSLQLWSRYDGWRVRRLRQPWPWWQAALVHAPVTTNQLALRHTLVALSSPLAVLLVGATSATLWKHASGAGAWVVAAVATIECAGFSIPQLLPWRWQRTLGAGAGELLRLLCVAPARVADLAVLRTIIVYEHRSIPIEDYAEPLLRRAGALPKEVPGSGYAGLVAAVWAMDRQEFDVAEQYFQRTPGLDHSLVPLAESAVPALRAYLYAFYRVDYAQALALYATIPAECPQVMLLAADAALRLLEGRRAEAIASAEAGLLVLDTDYKGRDVSSDRHRLQAVIARATAPEHSGG